MLQFEHTYTGGTLCPQKYLQFTLNAYINKTAGVVTHNVFTYQLARLAVKYSLLLKESSQYTCNNKTYKSTMVMYMYIQLIHYGTQFHFSNMYVQIF